MGHMIRAGTSYAVLAFAVGFVLGTLRVLVVAPRLGGVAAVLLELPIMLLASWFICGSLMARYDVSRRIAARLFTGALAFAVLMALEVTLALVGFGQSLTRILAGYQSLEGALGLFAQLGFGAIPLLQIHARSTAPH